MRNEREEWQQLHNCTIAQLQSQGVRARALIKLNGCLLSRHSVEVISVVDGGCNAVILTT